MSEPQQFRITACCSNCRGVFDATKGLACPACLCPHPAWATREDMQPQRGTQRAGDVNIHGPEENPYPHCLNRYGKACIPDCDACQWNREQYAKMIDAKPEIDWLDKLFALEDSREHKLGS